MKVDLDKINKELEYKSPEEIVEYIFMHFEQPLAMATSLSVEDQLLTYYLVKNDHPCYFFTLDTGRLPQETYETIAKTEEHFKIKIHVFFPDWKAVEEMVNTHGINLFYNSQELRKLCCKVRKTDVLVRALAGKKGWFTGIRREQAVTRINTPIIDWDSNNNMFKFSPLANLLEQEVWEKVESLGIPYNPLQKQGYRSLGCAPCTRPIGPEDDFRAGRWWWEEPESRECGLHVKKI